MNQTTLIEKSYENAKTQYAESGVNTDVVIDKLSRLSISIHCWQADDIAGFEKPDAQLTGGGIQITGNYPGKAKNVDELRMDLEKVYALIPGNHRLNLHAIYGEFGGKNIDRDQISPEHFAGWVDWAKHRQINLDFNATCFSHPKANSGFTLSSQDDSTRAFWIEHVKRCREISAFMGRTLQNPCIHNLWIPDGAKDVTVNRWIHRVRLIESLDQIYSFEYDSNEMKDAVESKLFGIGSESYVVGSHEFYMGYAISRGKMICLDLGHFHPTEYIADKISAILQFSDELLFHFSRGVRWDSDHVVILNDEVSNVAAEIVRAGVLDRVHIALDFFDASMNRIGAYVIGTRATLKSYLLALLEPIEKLKNLEQAGNHFAKLALIEELKTMPYGAVWDYYCLKMGVPVGKTLIDEVLTYENTVLNKR